MRVPLQLQFLGQPTCIVTGSWFAPSYDPQQTRHMSGAGHFGRFLVSLRSPNQTSCAAIANILTRKRSLYPRLPSGVGCIVGMHATNTSVYLALSRLVLDRPLPESCRDAAKTDGVRNQRIPTGSS
ncbi:hypothetical protein ACJBU6_03370 [Exserohilum turcicum]